MSKHARPEAYTAIQTSIGERVRWVRVLTLGNNQSEAARTLGMDPSTLNKIESGDRPPSIFNVIEIANRLRVSTDFLLRGNLAAKTDQELAVRLAAEHPELVAQLEDMDWGRDTGQASDKPRPPKRQQPRT